MDKKFVKNFLKGSASASIGMVASILFHFMSIMLMTRNMPKEDFGIYILILAVVHGLIILGGLGLDLTLVKFISTEKKSASRETLFAILVLRSIQLGLCCLLFYALSHFVLPLFDIDIEDFRAIVPILFVLASFRELFFFLLQGLQYFKKYAIVQVASAIFKFALILLAFATDRLNLHYLLYIEALMLLVSMSLQIVMIPFGRLLRVHWNRATIVEILRFSLPLYLNNILTFVYDRTHIFLIGAFLSPASVAYYSVANKIPTAFMRLFKSFINVYFPNISKLFSDGHKADAEKVMNKSLVISSITLLFCVLAAFLFRDEIITLIFSERYLPASTAFALLMLIFYLRSISNTMGYSLVGAGYSSVPVKVNAMASVVNIAGSLLMIPQLGFKGAIYSILIMNVLSQAFYYYYLTRAGIYPDVRNYLKPVAALAVAVGTYLLSGVSSPAMKVAMLLLYLILCWAMLKDFRSASTRLVRYLHQVRLQAKSA